MCVCQGTLLSYWMTCVCLSGDTVEAHRGTRAAGKHDPE